MAKQRKYGPYKTNANDYRGGYPGEDINFGGLEDIFSRMNSFYLTDDKDEYYDNDDLSYDMGDNGVQQFTNTWKLDDSGKFDWSLGYKHDKFGYYSHVLGTSKDDTINGGPQPEKIDGYGGNDRIFTNTDPFNTYVYDISDDTIRGGSGNDYIAGHAFGGSNTLYGEDDNDTILGGGGDDDIYGGDDQDVLFGNAGSDYLYGGAGNDIIFTGDLSNGESDIVDGGSGADKIVLGEASQGFTIPAEGFDWMSRIYNLGKDIVSYHIATHTYINKKGNPENVIGAPRAAYAQGVIPQMVDMIKAIAEGGDGEDIVIPATTGEYATVKEFDFRNDTLIVPVNDGVSNVLVTADTNGENSLGFTYDVGGNMFAAINLPEQLSYDAKKALAAQLEKNAVVIDSTGVVLGSNSGSSETIDTDVDLGGLGNKFYVFGAWGPQIIEGKDGADLLYGTDFDDVISGYALNEDDDAQTSGQAFAPKNAGTDQLYGYGGNDIFLGGKSGAGVDLFFGGEGGDYASYVDSTAGINANLATVLNDTNGDYLKVSNDGFGTSDKLYSVENIIGSPFDDTVSFNDADTTSDAAVEVKVYSSEGSQTPASGETNVLVDVENIIGSDNSNDTIDFSGLDGPLTLTMYEDGTATVVDESTNMTYNLEGFESFIGSASTSDRYQNTAVYKGRNDNVANLDDYFFESFEVKGQSTAGDLYGQEGKETTGDLAGQVINTGVTTFVKGNSWSSMDKYPRMMADINGDGNDDMVGFANRVVQAKLSNGDGTFGSTKTIFDDNAHFTVDDGGWTTQNEYPRMFGDIDGDGDDDIVGFGADQVYSALSNGDGTFADAQVAQDSGIFTPEMGWTTYDKNPRMVDDVNGDGYDDLIGFSNDGVRVALSNGDGTFGDVYTAFKGDFTYADGYTSQNVYPRMVGDINKDGRADIVGIDDNQVRFAWGQEDGTFYQPQVFNYNDQHNFLSKSQGWDNQEQYPRVLGDINGDGKDDIIGFNPDDDTVYVSYSKRDTWAFNQLQTQYGFNKPVALVEMAGDDSIADFTGAGWDSQNLYPRMMGDIDGNGQDDIIGFGHNDIFANVWE